MLNFMLKELLLDALPFGINDGFELVKGVNGIRQLNGNLDFSHSCISFWELSVLM